MFSLYNNMNSVYFFENVIDEIENNLAGEISVESLARKANMSVYEFRRIFTFVAKIPINEYIRKRRLSLAAVDLINTDLSVTQIAFKFGYDTASSFSRAFKEYHGASPKDVRDGGSSVRMLSRIGADIVTTGGSNIDYKIITDSAFYINGFSGKSDLDDTECCEKVWSDFYETEFSATFSEDEEIYVSYSNSVNNVDCVIGKRCTEEGENGILIPTSKWAVFTINTTDDQIVNAFYNDIIVQWLQSSGYCRKENLPNIEVYPYNMENDGFNWEIRIPVK